MPQWLEDKIEVAKKAYLELHGDKLSIVYGVESPDTAPLEALMQRHSIVAPGYLDFIHSCNGFTLHIVRNIRPDTPTVLLRFYSVEEAVAVSKQTWDVLAEDGEPVPLQPLAIAGDRSNVNLFALSPVQDHAESPVHFLDHELLPLWQNYRVAASFKAWLERLFSDLAKGADYLEMVNEIDRLPDA